MYTMLVLIKRGIKLLTTMKRYPCNEFISNQRLDIIHTGEINLIILLTYIYFFSRYVSVIIFLSLFKMVGGEDMDPIDFKVDNPWASTSIFDFMFFCCPECDCKSHNKQEFVDHTFNYHSWVSWNL